jgi:hypothetical protein
MNIRGFLKRANQMNYAAQLLDLSLRIIRNELDSGLIKSSDFEDLDIIDDLAALMTNRSRVLLIAEILNLLCKSE